MSEAVFKAQQAKRDEQDALVEDRRQPVSERTQELLETDIEGRNPYLWDLFEVVDISVPLSVYESVAIPDRDVAWAIEHAAMLAAATYQAQFELVIVDILDNAEASQHGILGKPVDPVAINKTIKRKEKQNEDTI